MNRKILGLPLAALALGALAFAVPQGDSAAEERPLASAVPEDVFLFVHGRHNPERAFLDAYWGEVWDAFVASGIVEDLTGLVMGAMEDDQRAVMERLNERFAGLIDAVDWGGLVGGETAFAERMPPMRFVGKGNPVATPDYVVLFRPGPGADRDAIHAGIEALMEALVDEVRDLAGVELDLERRQEGDVQVLVLSADQAVPKEAGIALALGRSGGIHFLSFGTEMLDDVVGLLNGSAELRAMADSPRLRSALERLPAPEDELTFFDMQNLRSDLDAMFAGIFEMAAAQQVSDQVRNTGENAEAVALRQKGIEVYQADQYEEALKLMEASLEVDPSDSTTIYNIACLHALLGHPDQALEWLDRSVEAGFHAPAKLGSDEDLTSLRGDPRFEAAVARARELSGPAGGEEISIARTLLTRLLDSMGILDYAATVTSTDGHSTYSDSLSVLVEDAQGNPLYPVLAGGTPIEDFTRWLPREATSFTVDSSLSVQALYGFVRDTVQGMGPAGEQGWQAWEDAQLKMDFVVEEDLLSWMGPTSVQASLDLDAGAGWILLMEALDEEAAREGLDWALELIPEMIAELAAQAPPLAMMQMRVSPTQNAELEGFHDVSMGMMPQPMVFGVRDGWMMMGSSQDALLTAIRTASGEHESVRANEALMAKLLVPDGPVQSIRFTDHTGDAQEAVAILGAVAMGGGMVASQIPDPDEREVVTQLLRILGKLGPVIAKIDFYDSSASYTRFDGRAWTTHAVTHYVPPTPAEDGGDGGQ
jgi:tetratricopeptide (TPR) repeat protein